MGCVWDVYETCMARVWDVYRALFAEGFGMEGLRLMVHGALF